MTVQNDVGQPELGWPAWQKMLASALILVHLAALLGLVLSSPSGPWLLDGGEGIAHAPYFANVLYRKAVGENYFYALKLDDDYRFKENERPVADYRVEIRIKNEDGSELKKIELPDPQSFPGARNRQKRLVSLLADHEVLDAPEGERIPPAGQTPPLKQYWRVDESGAKANLVTVPEHLLPRDEAIIRPTDLGLVLARSVAKRALGMQGGAKAEVVVIARPTFGAVVVMPNGPVLDENDFQTNEFNFGLVTK